MLFMNGILFKQKFKLPNGIFSIKPEQYLIENNLVAVCIIFLRISILPVHGYLCLSLYVLEMLFPISIVVIVITLCFMVDESVFILFTVN